MCCYCDVKCSGVVSLFGAGVLASVVLCMLNARPVTSNTNLSPESLSPPYSSDVSHSQLPLTAQSSACLTDLTQWMPVVLLSKI